MRFLGIRNGHDANVTYTNGKEIKYMKLERNLQVKHFLYDGTNTDNDVPDIIIHARKVFGIQDSDIDAICINPSNDRHQVVGFDRPDVLWQEIDKYKNPFWSGFHGPVYVIDHHYAHTLSLWPMVDPESVKYSFVVDGEGDHVRHTSVFKDDELIEFLSLHTGSIPKALENWAELSGMKGMALDFSGKMMALQALHNIPPHVLENLRSMLGLYGFNQMLEFGDLIQRHHVEYSYPFNKSASPMENFQKAANMSQLLHLFGEETLPRFFEKHMNNVNSVCSYSGGVAQNTCLNSVIRKKIPNVIIPPHCPDDGISLGCVELLRRIFKQPKFYKPGFPYWQSDVAPEYSPYKRTIEKTAEYLAQGKIVGWYQGHGELGPRALGNRSILMDPSIVNGKDIINSKVKRREPYRPFGASVLKEHSDKYFDFPHESPYMLYVAKFKCSDFPAVTHLDGTCRHQTVGDGPETAIYRDLITKFSEKTGIPMVLNTSLNVDGKPIAASPEDAKTLFDSSALDVLVVGDNMMVK